jgi:hypothetical protein
MVGNSGSAGSRFAWPTPSARILPARTSGRTVGMLLMVNDTSPARSAVAAGAVPL